MSNNHGVAERMVTTRARTRSEQTRLTIALTLLSQVWAGVSSSVLTRYHQNRTKVGSRRGPIAKNELDAKRRLLALKLPTGVTGVSGVIPASPSLLASGSPLGDPYGHHLVYMYLPHLHEGHSASECDNTVEEAAQAARPVSASCGSATWSAVAANARLVHGDGWSTTSCHRSRSGGRHSRLRLAARASRCQHTAAGSRG